MLAPIVLFVYNRPEHTRKTLEALSNNLLAEESHLYIFADGPKENENKENITKINLVRNIIALKKWCKEVHVFQEKKNKGLANSIIEGANLIFQQYNKAIFLEDDIVTSSSFLDFMNKNLDYYAYDEKVFGISGFCYPNKGIKDTTYFLPIGSSWGWATWKGRWKNINFDAKELLIELEQKNLQRPLNFSGYRFYEMLVDQSHGRINSWAICFYASFFLQNGVFLFPNVSLVENIGFDNSGEHCHEDSYFGKVESQIILDYSKIPIMVKRSISKKIRLVPQSSLVKKIYRKLKGKINYER